ncbi:TIR domain-containing protein [Actinoplanes sp. G11-F43]|uniref:TIR domain-containing protein n=1 Tax=Actinoplanes sp. G11-F43 TaxID=3424130 RepID=UPI003D342FA1
MINVFLSWSGKQSEEVAKILYRWLPKILTYTDPFMSKNMTKGTRWLEEMTTKLEGSSFGIICVTAENYRAPWLNFEVGVLSHKLQKARVTPFLVGVDVQDVNGPATEIFQAATFARDEVYQLVTSINDHVEGEGRIKPELLPEIFETWWPQLEEQLNALLAAPAPAPPKRSDHELLTEVLVAVQAQSRLLADPGTLLPAAYLNDVMAEIAQRQSAGTSGDETGPLSAIENARISVSGILNCGIGDSVDADQPDAFLKHRQSDRVRIRRIIVTDDEGGPHDFVERIIDQAKEQRNYEVKVIRASAAKALGAWAFSVVDHRIIVIRLPHNRAFAIRGDRAAELLSEQFETFWAAAESPHAGAGVPGQRLSAGDS